MRQYAVMGKYVIEIPAYINVVANSKEEAKKIAGELPTKRWNFGEEKDYVENNRMEVTHVLTCRQMELPLND